MTSIDSELVATSRPSSSDDLASRTSALAKSLQYLGHFTDADGKFGSPDDLMALNIVTASDCAFTAELNKIYLDKVAGRLQGRGAISTWLALLKLDDESFLSYASFILALYGVAPPAGITLLSLRVRCLQTHKVDPARMTSNMLVTLGACE